MAWEGEHEGEAACGTRVEKIGDLLAQQLLQGAAGNRAGAFQWRHPLPSCHRVARPPAPAQRTATPLSCALKEWRAAISRSAPRCAVREGSQTAQGGRRGATHAAD